MYFKYHVARYHQQVDQCNAEDTCAAVVRNAACACDEDTCCAQIGGSGVLVQPMTYIFDEEPERWQKVLAELDIDGADPVLATMDA